MRLRAHIIYILSPHIAAWLDVLKFSPDSHEQGE